MQKQFSFQYELYNGIAELSSEEQKVLLAAKEATKLAYAPYSQFNVGAALMLIDGTILKGANQENAAFPSGICAERSLIATAANLYQNIHIKLLAITFNTIKEIEDFILTPCGQCRQVINETAQNQNQPIKVIMSSSNGKVIIVNDNQWLLPLAFQKLI